MVDSERFLYPPYGRIARMKSLPALIVIIFTLPLSVLDGALRQYVVQ